MNPPPRRPQEQLPTLVPGAVRRLVRLDVLRAARPDGGRPPLTVDATAEDALGTPDGPRTLAQARVRLDVDAQGRVQALTTEPAAPLETVLGVPVSGGLRAAAREALAAQEGADGPSPLAALLDDVPVAVLVSGYLDVRAGRLGDGAPDLMRDICSGWRADGEPFAIVERTRAPHASELTAVADARLGQPLPVLPPGSLRRTRWITVEPAGDGTAAVSAGFRDSCRDGDRPEGVLHEYALTARLDDAGAVRDVRPEPRVLPFSECVLAVPETAALEGEPAGELRRRVPRLLPGTRGCTHLNDLLRALSCTPRLLHLAGAPH